MSTHGPARTTRTVRVELDADRSYDVIVGAGILAQLPGRLASLGGGSRALLVIHDRAVPAEHLAVLDAGGGHRTTVTSWTPSESRKSLAQAGEFLETLAAARLERSDFVVALGGGITGDVAGFVAGIYRRGVPWVNCPTTLLAMVDASVGGKTGVNLDVARAGSRAMLKNMVGVFHQPRLVIADVRTLASLPERERRCGMAECVKHGLVSGDRNDPGLLDWITVSLPAIARGDEDALIELVARNIAIKAAVVSGDERETGRGPGGGRMALNLGHTFGHALEGFPELGLAHGEAVGLGVLAAATCAERLGLVGPDVRATLERLLGPGGIGLPASVPDLPPAEKVFALMHEDKKVSGGALRLILPVPGRRVQVCDNPPADAVLAAIDSIRAP